MEIRVSRLEGLSLVVEEVRKCCQAGIRIFTLSGDLGAGKTTFIQTFCAAAGVVDQVSSPTFSLINNYHSSQFGVIHHMDLYRLDKETDLEQIGLSEYLDSGNLCFIEWPALADNLIIPPYTHISILVEPDNIRTFIITTYDTVDA